MILFSSEDWVANCKERRVGLAGVRDLFDEILRFRDGEARKRMLRRLMSKYPCATFVWVDDRPHRFIGNLNERVVLVWFKFPATARWEEAAAQRIPNLRFVENWRKLGELVRSILSEGNVEKEKNC